MNMFWAGVLCGMFIGVVAEFFRQQTKIQGAIDDLEKLKGQIRMDYKLWGKKP